MVESKAASKPASKPASRSATPAKSTTATTAAKSATAAKSSATASKLSATAAKSSAKSAKSTKSAAKKAPQGQPAQVYNLRDPWFTLVVTGAKTRHVHWAEPKPSAPGRPESGSPGWQDLVKGDIVAFRNPALGFERLCQVQITAVTHAVTTTNVVAKMSEPAMLKAAFPTLSGGDQVEAVLGGMAKTAVERPLVVIGFRRLRAA